MADSRIGGSIWAWLAGLSAAIFIMAITYGVTNRNTQTALDRNAPVPSTAYSTGGASTTGFGGTSGGGMETTGASPGGADPNGPWKGGQ